MDINSNSIIKVVNIRGSIFLKIVKFPYPKLSPCNRVKAANVKLYIRDRKG